MLYASSLYDCRGADVRVKDRQGRTPLLTAAVAGSLACLKCIMKKSLWAVDDSDKYDRTALFLAAKYNRLEIVKVGEKRGSGIESE